MNKTIATDASVDGFLAAAANDVRRRDGRALCEMMRRISGVAPRMWGPSIVGFGTQHYRYESGREGDMPRIAFSPRKANLVLYLGRSDDPGGKHVNRLGKHRRGVSCLYVNKLADIDLDVLETMVRETWQATGPGSGQ